jgi:hypothetical protein
MILLLGGAVGSDQAGDWPMFRYDPSHTGCTNEKISGYLELLWCYELSLFGFARYSPAVSDRKVFVGNALPFGGKSYCFEATTELTPPPTVAPTPKLTPPPSPEPAKLTFFQG